MSMDASGLETNEVATEDPEEDEEDVFDVLGLKDDIDEEGVIVAAAAANDKVNDVNGDGVAGKRDNETELVGRMVEFKQAEVLMGVENEEDPKTKQVGTDRQHGEN
ncbi:unnamed protein product [Protopolystoma xenopodis]|uniref:Uncharacterized protein n=1 Tax=Protopolystoma xenopodis TaxID=117903 RepID=A0A448WFB5_9PLAT|nr:unnamed protein product [Protopolystoma xenopodis]